MSLASEIWELRWIAILLTGLFLFFLFSKYWAGDVVKVWGKNLTRKDLRYILHFFGTGFIIYICNKYFFSEVSSFLYISIAIFTPISALIWHWADKKNDVYVEENTMQGEMMFKLGAFPEDMKKFAVPNTGVRIMRMPIWVYQSKRHEGELSALFWKKGNLVYTDLYDGETLYHPEHPDLHNINFYEAKIFWLEFKKRYPEVARKILKLTWLFEWALVDAQEQLEAEAWIALKENRLQHPVPFDIAMTREEAYNKVRAEITYNLSQQELLRGRDEPRATEDKAKTATLKDMEKL